MTHLTETRKECLKALVKMVREGTIPEEFQVLYYGAREGPVLVGKDGQHTYGVTGLSRLGLEALTRAELLFSLPSYQRHASSFSTSTTETESERRSEEHT